MERDWERRRARDAPSLAHILDSVAGALRDRSILRATPLGGGKINLHVRLDLVGATEPVVLRVILGEAAAASKEATLLERFAGVLPVPAVLDRGVLSTDGVERPWLLLSWVPGAALDTWLADAPPAARVRAGHEAGAALAAVHAHTYDRPGFLAADLSIARPLPPLVETWSGYVEQQVDRPCAMARLGRARCKAVRGFVQERAADLEPLEARCTLLHADFKPVNVFADTDGDITALLDWEFAWSGPHLFDWGQMLRWPLPAEFEAALVAGYRAAGGLLEGAWRHQARLLDVMNLVGFLGDDDDRPRMVSDVLALLDATLATGAA